MTIANNRCGNKETIAHRVNRLSQSRMQAYGEIKLRGNPNRSEMRAQDKTSAILCTPVVGIKTVMSNLYTHVK